MPRFGYWFIGQLVGAPAAVPGATPSAAIQCWILFAGRQMQLAPGDNILGRAPDAAVWIDETSVSRHHARIHVDVMTATLEDLNSKNGTFVRGERLTSPLSLADGDEIQLGSVVVTFRSPAASELTETASIFGQAAEKRSLASTSNFEVRTSKFEVQVAGFAATC